MSQYAAIVSENCTILWGLKSLDRIQGQLNAVNIPILTDTTSKEEPNAIALLIDSNFLFDSHTLQNFVNSKSKFLVCSKTSLIAALKCEVVQINRFKNIIGSIATFEALNSQESDLKHYNDHLRKSKPPLVMHMPDYSVEELETVLYGNSYKGVTDFITKWWWPRPAKKIVKLCTNRNIKPNAVTLLGACLMFLALFFFAQGLFALGLLSGWLMTLLDTVDGKLARVTEQTSKLGHLLDHGMDIIHPPVWYFFWGVGLLGSTSFLGLDSQELSKIMIYGYIGGRIIEGLFEGLGSCSLFAWRPADAYFRLFVARRNPCLVILTITTLLGAPESGFIGVVGWTVVCTVILTLRFTYASYVRLHKGKLSSWLQDPSAAENFPQAFKTFSKTQKAYAR